MAIWQYRINLLPEASIERIWGCVPASLPEYASVGDDTEIGEVPMHDYWGGVDIFQDIFPLAEQILPQTLSKSESEIRLGCREGNRITLWRDDVLFQFDLREPDFEVLEAVLRLARRTSCRLAVGSDGSVIRANMLEVLESIRVSSAYKFVKDPIGYLKQLGRKSKEDRNQQGF